MNADSVYAERIAELDRNWPPEEIARINREFENDRRPGIPHEEVMRRLGLLIRLDEVEDDEDPVVMLSK